MNRAELYLSMDLTYKEQIKVEDYKSKQQTWRHHSRHGICLRTPTVLEE